MLGMLGLDPGPSHMLGIELHPSPPLDSFQSLKCCLSGKKAVFPGDLALLWLRQLFFGWGSGHILRCSLSAVDNHDIISIKLFQLMVERTPEEESIDWTKIEPGVSFLKSPKGMSVYSPALPASRTLWSCPAVAVFWALSSVTRGRSLGQIHFSEVMSKILSADSLCVSAEAAVPRQHTCKHLASTSSCVN